MDASETNGITSSQPAALVVAVRGDLEERDACQSLRGVNSAAQAIEAKKRFSEKSGACYLIIHKAVVFQVSANEINITVSSHADVLEMKQLWH